MRRWAICLLVAAAALATGARPGHAQIQPLDELLVELRIEGGPRVLVEARTDGALLALDLAGTLRAAGIEMQPGAAAGVLAGTLYPAEIGLRVDTEAGVVVRGPERIEALPDEIFLEGPTIFAATSLVEFLLDVVIDVSLSEQLALVRGGDDLPAVAAQARQLRRARAGFRDPAAWSGVEVPVSRGWLGGAALDWDLSLGTFASAGTQRYSTRFRGSRLGLGLELFGGSAAVFYQRNGGSESFTGSDRSEISWFRAWPQNRWVRQLRLGDVPGAGPVGRFVRGFSISNIPFLRPPAFTPDIFRGTVPEGWGVELYSGERLLDVGEVGQDGAWSFDVPLRFGFNPYEVRAYGPNGQVEYLDRSWFVFSERLPAGTFEYALNAGQCRLAACSEGANLDMRWGLSEQLTIRGGAAGLAFDTIADEGIVYASATYQPTRALSVTGNWISETLTEGLVRFYPSSDLQADLSLSALSAGSPDPRQRREADTRDVRASVVWRPRSLGRRTTFRVFASRSSTDLRTRDDYGASVATQISRLRIDLAGSRARTAAQDGDGFDSYRASVRSILLLPAQAGPLNGAALRFGAGIDDREGFESTYLGFSQGISNDWRFLVQGGWDAVRGTTLRIDVKATLDGLRLNSRNEIAGEGSQGVQTLQGSVLFGAAGSPVSLADGIVVGRAGATGVAFRDLDGDGIRDEGEPPVPGVSIQLEGRRIRTDADGAWSIWDLAPFEEVRLEVEEASGSDFRWTPLERRYRFWPEPNRFNRIDIPLVQTMELIGEIRLQPGGRAVGGVDVVLTNLDSGREYRETTFSDGGFYFLGVVPGRYQVRLLQSQLPDAAPGIDVGVLEVISNPEGVIGDLRFDIDQGDLERLERQLDGVRLEGLLPLAQPANPAAAARTGEAARPAIRLSDERTRAERGSRWIRLPRTAATGDPGGG